MSDTESASAPSLCPNCSHPLQPTDHDGLAVEQCTACHGFFFRMDELERIVRGLQQQSSTRFERRPFKINRKRGALRCPDCTVLTIHEGAIGETKIWRCNSCKGMYLPYKSLTTLFDISDRRRGLLRRKSKLDAEARIQQAWDTREFIRVFFRL